MTNVLIVDDEKIEREGLKYLLSREEGKEMFLKLRTENRLCRLFGQRTYNLF